jgi:hypothetical protein
MNHQFLASIDLSTRKYLFSRRASLARLEGASNPSPRMHLQMRVLRENIAATEQHRGRFGLDPING